MTINNGHLNGEEYRAIRKVLGLSQQDAQEFHGLKNRRTINQWESCRNTTSACACAKILNTLHLANEFIKDKFFNIRHHRSQPAIFLTYKDEEDERYTNMLLNEFPTLGAYKMAIARAYVEALERGFDSHIVIFSSKEYESYLVANNLDDTLANRDDWARIHYIKFCKA